MARFGILMTLFVHTVVFAENTLQTDAQKLSYSFGQQVGLLLQQQGIQFDVEALTLGVKDALGRIEPRLSAQDMQQRLVQYQTEVLEKKTKVKETTANKNKQTGTDFLAQNKLKPNVVTLPSGLQYRIISAGSGVSPKVESTVVTHYRGTLINGAEFDSSYARQQPLSFKLNGVIKGWTEALQLMKPGAKWEIFVPYDLAYGAGGAGDAIGPYETLIFEIELISVKS